MVHKRLADRVLYERISSRILNIKLLRDKGLWMDLNITVAYAPHNGWGREIREEFWEDLHKLEDSKLKTPISGRIILIDANGEIGRGIGTGERGKKGEGKREEGGG